MTLIRTSYDPCSVEIDSTPCNRFQLELTGCAKLSAQGSFIFKNPVEKMIFVCIKDRYEKISLLAFKTKIHRE